jgi:ribosomal protein L40E
MFLFVAAQDRDVILFSHQYHVLEEEMACADCHTTVGESTTGSDNLLPAMEVCADCHDVDDESGCNQCHNNVEQASTAARITDYNQLFSHEKHLSADLECSTCHGEVEEIGINKHLKIPDMIKCMDCHQNKVVSTECRTCHTSDERIKPANHDLAFMETHGDIASNFVSTMGKNCATCHKTEFCQDCHEGENLNRFSHPLNFEFTHALSAQGKERNCFTCHENRDFCSSCHLSNNVLPYNHTAGWTNQIDGDGGRHRIEAMIDLENCMSCHEHNADQICQQCHNNN